MNFKSHRVAGVCLGLIGSTMMTRGSVDSLSLSTVAIVTSASFIGSTLPDIDEPSSIVGKSAKPISKLIKHTMGHRGAFHSPFVLAIICLLLWIGSAFLPNTTIVYRLTQLLLIMAILPTVKRRGVKGFVGKVLMIIAALLILCIQQNVVPLQLLLRLCVIGVAIGMGSHLLMDSLTVGGIPWLFPLTNKKYHFLNLRTNEHEVVAQLLFILPTICVMYFMYEEIFNKIVQ